MTRMVALVAVLLSAGTTLAPQAPEKELVASISGPALAAGVVSGIAWDGGMLVIQTVGVDKTGTRSTRYLIVPGRAMELRTAAEPPPGVERYWAMKASRVSPTGIGRISANNDAKLPMYGIAAQERRMLDAVDMGGTQQVTELRLGDLLLYRRTGGVPPYDGEVWSWSPAEINRIAYVDASGDLWIARADGYAPERVLKGKFTLPAWSQDGTVLAVTERKSGGAKWDVFVIHLPEKYRR